MSGNVVTKLTRFAQTEKVRGLCDALTAAVAARDLGQISRLDYALRSGVMAMLGEGAPRDAEDLALLSDALKSLNNAVATLRNAQRRGRGVRAAYLARIS